MMNEKIAEKSFAVEARYGNFYAGGDIAWSTDGSTFYCLNNGCVNAVSVVNGQISSCYGGSIKSADKKDERITDDFSDDVVYAFALSTNNEHLVTAHRSSLLRLWSVAEAKVLKVWKSMHKGPVVKLTFSTCNRFVCSSGSDSIIRLWDYNLNSCHAVFRDFKGPATLVQFHPKSEKTELFVAGSDHTIYCWNYESKELTGQLRGHISPVTALSFSANHKYMTSVGRDKVLILWKLKNAEQMKIVPLYEDLEGVVFWRDFNTNADEFEVLVGSSAGNFKLVNASNSQVSAVELNIAQELKQILHCGKTKQLAFVTAEHNILVYDVAENSKLAVVKQLVGFNDDVLDMCLFGPADRFLAVATNSPHIKLYDTEQQMNCKIFAGHTDSVLSLSACSAANDRHFLLSAGKDHSLRLWQLLVDSSELVCVNEHPNAHTVSIGSVSFGYNAANILASVSEDGSLKVWQLLGLEGSKKKAKYSLNVKYAAVAHEKEVHSVAFAPNNKLLATGSQDKTAKVWSTETQNLLGTLRGHKRGIWCVRFSPADQVLLTASGDCHLRLWDLSSMTCLKTFDQDVTVLRAEFIEYGKYFVASSSDGLIKVWNIKTNDCMEILDAHEDRVWALAVPHKSKLCFYSGGADSQLVKWRDVTDEVRNDALDKRQKNLEDEQLLQNLLQERKNLEKAFLLALRLDKPKTTYDIVQEYVKKDDREGIKVLSEKLNVDLKTKLFEHIKSWNTNSKHAYVANMMLQPLLTDLLVHPEEQRNFNMTRLVESLLPYAQRHFNRATNLCKDIAFLEYLVESM